MSNNFKRPPISRHFDPTGEENPQSEPDAIDQGVIEGKNAVIEALRAGRPIDKVFLSDSGQDKALRHIASTARDAGAVVVDSDRRKLDSISRTGSHQGVIAIASLKEYCTIQDILDVASSKGEKPFIIICDEISDPHNLGAIIRTAEASGAHGVIIPKRRSAGITAVVEKTSAGAASHMAVARVANLSQTIKELKKSGVWVFGAASDGNTKLWDADFRDATAIVIGSEGSGISRLVSEHCDVTVSIPMTGKTPSLNASVSAAVLLYEGMRQRNCTT